MAVERALPYDENYRRSSHYKIMLERHNFVQQFVKNKVVLDTCCGVGWGTYKFSKDAKEVYGVDISPEAIQYAKNHYRRENLVFNVMNVSRLRFSHNQFDITTALESIEHFSYRDGKRYLEEIRCVLKPDGLLVGTTPVCEDEEQALIYKEINPYHLCPYTKENLQNQLQAIFTKFLILEKFNYECSYFLFFATNDERVHKKIMDNYQVKQLLSERYKINKKYAYKKGKYHFIYAASKFVKGDLRKARKYFLKTIKLNIFDLKAYIYVCLTFLPLELINKARKIKHKLTKKVNENE